jgi:hypothetical protein
MKYRCLTYKEFDLLSTDFSNFLYSEGINRYEWKILQDQYSDYAFKLLKKYSDLTFEKVMKDVQYLEYRTAKQLLLFECRKEQFVTIGIDIPKNSSINLTDISSFQELSRNELHLCRTFKFDSPYRSSREEEIFNFIEAGYYIVDEKTYNRINFFRQAYLN